MEAGRSRDLLDPSRRYRVSPVDGGEGGGRAVDTTDIYIMGLSGCNRNGNNKGFTNLQQRLTEMNRKIPSARKEV